MATMDDLFTEYLKSIMPDDPAIKRAKTAHEDLRKDLEADEKFGLRVERSLLSGSYGRDTATHGIKDVDIIIQTTFTVSEIVEKKRPSETEQLYLLRITREAIERTGRVAKTKPARRSINVELPQEINEIGEDLPPLTLDIVPVLIPLDKDHDPMQIADRQLSQWYYTYPNTQLEDSVVRNQKSKEISGYRSYKSLVKIIKSWKKVHFGDDKTPKGFVLECFVAQHHNPGAEHWLDAVQDFFENICQQWPDPEMLQFIPTAHDISNVNPDPIPLTKKIEDAKRVLNKLHWSLTQVKLAREKSETDLFQAAKILQRVFGADTSLDLCFPLPPEDDSSKKTSVIVPQSGSKHNIREAEPFG